MYVIYWLIAENSNKTYVGFTSDIDKRLDKHRQHVVKSTRDFGKFRCFILEKAQNATEARKIERYWKSCAGRKKLKIIFINKALSSNG